MHRSLISTPAAVSALAVACALAGPARAGVPERGEGTVTVLAGWRAIPQHALMAQLQHDQQEPIHNAFQAGFLVGLGFMPDDDLHVSIDLGYSTDRWALKDGDAAVKVIIILLSGDTSVLKGPRWSLYLGGGLGYSLNTFSRYGRDAESNGSAGFLKAGFRWQLAGPVALVIEDRYTLSSADYPELKSIINVGGNLLSVGLHFHFFSPPEKGHPAGP